MGDGLLDRLGLGAVAGFALGAAAANHPGDPRTVREFAREALAELLRLAEDPRLTALPSALTSALSLPPPAGHAAPPPRRRRRTRAQIEADAAASAATAAATVAAAPTDTFAAEEPPRPRRRGHLPAQPSAVPPATVLPAVGMPSSAADLVTADDALPPRRWGRRPRPPSASAPPVDIAVTAAVEPSPSAESVALPEVEEEKAAGRRSASDGLLNLNTATRGELMRLPRIGAQGADRIIAYREEHGVIHGLRDLRRAEAISVSAARQIRPLVRFR